MNTFKTQVEEWRKIHTVAGFIPILLSLMNNIKLITAVRKAGNAEEDALLSLFSNLKDNMAIMPFAQLQYTILYDVMNQSIRAKYYIPSGAEFTYLSAEAEKTLKLIYKEM